jgi:16S rRNA (guanine966-N2)-methyltransferase
MSTRISGGFYRSRILKTPPGNETRPTSTRVKEALFSILEDVSESIFIDLYAGSGSVGLEALSRGASKVILVENGRPALQCIRENVKSLKAEDVEIVASDVEKYCSSLKENFCDILFVDPPFVKDYPDFRNIFSIVKPGGVAVFQYPSRADIGWLKEADVTKTYGESAIALFYL